MKTTPFNMSLVQSPVNRTLLHFIIIHYIIIAEANYLYVSKSYVVYDVSHTLMKV